jgi:acetate kinase
MRRLHEAASSNADAPLAIQMFCYSVRKQVAAMIAALDGVDLIVFTGGIGETPVLSSELPQDGRMNCTGNANVTDPQRIKSHC